MKAKKGQVAESITEKDEIRSREVIKVFLCKKDKHYIKQDYSEKEREETRRTMQRA